jgi:hypothetical protein
VWRAYTLKEALRAIFKLGLSIENVTILIDRFVSNATRSRLGAFIRLAKPSVATATGSSTQSASGSTHSGPRVRLGRRKKLAH